MQKYSAHFDYAGDFVDRWNRTFKKTRAWMFALAAALIAAGVFSAMAPAGMYVLIQGVAATALLVRGGSQVVSYAAAPELSRNSPMLVTGLLNVLLGVMLFVLPSSLTASALVFLLAFMLIFTGAERISFARRMRYFGIPGMGAATVIGVVNVVLGLLFILVPAYSSLALAYAMAAYLIMSGASVLIEALAMKRIASA